MEFIYFFIVIAYAVFLLGFFNRDYAITMLGIFLMYSLSLFIFVNGIDVFNNFLTETFAMVTFGLASYIGIRGGIELIQKNYN